MWTPWIDIDGDQVNEITIVKIDQKFRRGANNFVQIRMLNEIGQVESNSRAFNIKINTYPEIVVVSPSPGDRLMEGRKIIFDASLSFDPDGDRINVSWFRTTPTGLESMGDS